MTTERNSSNSYGFSPEMLERSVSRETLLAELEQFQLEPDILDRILAHALGPNTDYPRLAAMALANAALDGHVIPEPNPAAPGGTHG